MNAKKPPLRAAIETRDCRWAASRKVKEEVNYD